MTLNDFRKILGMSTMKDIFGTEDSEDLPQWAIDNLLELDIRFSRMEIETRETGVKEAVIYIPFKTEVG